jgi:hypothetical protein
MPSRKKKSDRTSSMYPTLHENVSQLLEEDNLYFSFYDDDDESSNCIKSYDTNVMGRFSCHNRSCSSQGWSSRVVAITIRMYPEMQYNARVYYQRCRQCNRPSKPKLDDSYAERVAYRLKKWSGVDMEQPHYSGHSKGPHESNLCEGCKAGHCTWKG